MLDKQVVDILPCLGVTPKFDSLCYRHMEAYAVSVNLTIGGGSGVTKTTVRKVIPCRLTAQNAFALRNGESVCTGIDCFGTHAGLLSSSLPFRIYRWPI